MLDQVSISELSGLSDAPPRAIRYYESLGLLSPSRSTDGARIYRRADGEVVRAIHKAFTNKLNLREISDLLKRGERDQVARLISERIKALTCLKTYLRDNLMR